MLEKNPGFTGAYGFLASVTALKGDIENSKIYFDNLSVGKIIKEIIPVVYEKDINLLNKTSN